MFVRAVGNDMSSFVNDGLTDVYLRFGDKAARSLWDPTIHSVINCLSLTSIRLENNNIKKL